MERQDADRSKRRGGIMRDFFREFNRLMTRGYIVIIHANNLIPRGNDSVLK
jgi:hypothetical protein